MSVVDSCICSLLLTLDVRIFSQLHTYSSTSSPSRHAWHSTLTRTTSMLCICRYTTRPACEGTTTTCVENRNDSPNWSSSVENPSFITRSVEFSLARRDSCMSKVRFPNSGSSSAVILELSAYPMMKPRGSPLLFLFP